ncbi:unnamed protein product [Rhizophagus irregularis]|nr:unnamed protein product [Rhizophagus irregularis]CAB5357769.1 unnamed protein product [Rhizophagus irregularis]
MSSETSTPYTPASTSTTVAGNETTYLNLHQNPTTSMIRTNIYYTVLRIYDSGYAIWDPIRSECYTMRKCFTN